MKKFITLAIICLAFSAVSFAQTPTTNTGAQKSYYLELYEISILTARSVSINWGINTPNPATQTFKLLNQNGEVINFDNIVGAINYLASFGWEVVSVYERAYKGSRTTYYLLHLDGTKHSHKQLTGEIDKALANLQTVQSN